MNRITINGVDATRRTKIQKELDSYLKRLLMQNETANITVTISSVK